MILPDHTQKYNKQQLNIKLMVIISIVFNDSASKYRVQTLWFCW